VVLTGIQLGGQAALTYTVENYPGFPEGVGGAQLGELFQKQAEHFGARVEFDSANEVDLSERPYKVRDRQYRIPGGYHHRDHGCQLQPAFAYRARAN